LHRVFIRGRGILAGNAEKIQAVISGTAEGIEVCHRHYGGRQRHAAEIQASESIA
jgi:hypothetical protein